MGVFKNHYIYSSFVLRNLMATKIFEQITLVENKNTNIFLSTYQETTGRLYTNKNNKSVKIMDYEFKLIHHKEAIEHHNIIYRSSEAILFENIDTFNKKILKSIKKKIKQIIGGTPT